MVGKKTRPDTDVSAKLDTVATIERCLWSNSKASFTRLWWISRYLKPLILVRHSVQPPNLLKSTPIERCHVLSFAFEHYAKKSRSRDEVIVLAYDSGGYGMKEIGDYFGLHYSRASRIISGLGRAKDKT